MSHKPFRFSLQSFNTDSPKSYRTGTIGADGMGSGMAEATAKKIKWIKDGAGYRFADIELEIGVLNPNTVYMKCQAEFSTQ
jgi:hypothetical protein